MKLRILFILILVLCFNQTGFSQNNLRTKRILISSDTVQLDSLLILPATVQVSSNGKKINPEWYRIDSSTGQLILSDKLHEIQDSIKISYRIYNYNINKEIYTRDLSQINLSGTERPNRFSGSSNFSQRGILNNNQLEKQGSYLRGISYGNNQDVVTNSSLNLQLSGKLSDDVNILAAISDNNIPIQPDGNTQSIQDFDRIFIKLFDDNNELILGDYEINNPQGHFMRFNKKVQGGKFSGIISKTKNGNVFKSTVSASIAKGKFKRMEIQASEGIQGPYRLTGLNNEAYIVVLAGSEKVFVDGKRLTRGERNDYVINYNTAELSFTTKQLITYKSRIVVEFEYSEQNYSRFLIFNANEYDNSKGKFWLNFYHEQDGKNQSLDQNLSEENKMLLSEIGDNLNLAVVPNQEIVEYSNDYILYRKTSKTIDNQTYEVFEYSNNPEEAIYRINFSYVGNNSGNYVLLNTTLNGRVYEWVDPVNGISQGDYEPVTKLIPPQKQQMLSAGMDYNFNDNFKSKVEIAMSNLDLNTFSNANDADNKGWATDISLQKKTFLSDTTKQLLTKLKMHYIHKNFNEIETFRSVEFDRDWNIDESSDKNNESFVSISNLLTNPNWGSTSYTLSFLKREKQYHGLNQSLTTDFNRKNLSLTFNGNLLTTDQQSTESQFYRHQLNISYATKIAKLGLETENENNQLSQKVDRSLLSNSYAFYSYKLYVENLNSDKNQYQAYYKRRKDFSPVDKNFNALTESEDFGAKISLKKNRNNQLQIESVYRKLKILNNSISNLKPENSFLGKLEHQARIKKGLLVTSSYYELASGLESEKEYTYVKVNDGQGIYKWTDYNSNGIKELNEFDAASFQDEANYIRIANNTSNYVKVYTSQFRQSFNLQLRKIKSKSGFLKLMARFNNRFAYHISKKSLQNNFNLYANPFKNQSSNENLTSISSGIQNTLTYRKPRSKTNWSVLLVSNNGKQILTQGFERRQFNSNGFRFNWRIGKSNQLSNRIDLIEKSLYHENFASQDYRLSEIKNELQLKFQPSLVFQFGLNYTFHQKENQLAIEHSNTNNIGVSCQYSIKQNGKLQAHFNFINIDYNTDSNTSIAYEMLEGYLPGKNASWNLAYNQKISKIFEMNISYNGRQSEKANTIHVGSMEIRAYF